MVVHAFPAAKLGALLIKQISKPIANAVKQGAKSSPVFRKYVCLPPAKLYTWCEVKGKMWLLKLGQPVNITVLNEAASIELGANLLGESVIFIIAAAILVFEYNRSSNKEAAKEESRKMELQELRDSVRDLFIQLEQQGAYIREITRRVAELDNGSRRSSYKPPTPQDPPPEQGGNVPLQEEEKSTNPEVLANMSLMHQSDYKPLKGVIYTALEDVENNLFLDNYQKREPGILTVALNLLYQDVHRNNLTF